MSVYGPDYHFQGNGWNVHLVKVWWFKDGNWCFVLSHAIGFSQLIYAQNELSGFGLRKLVSPLHMEVPRPHVISGPTHT